MNRPVTSVTPPHFLTAVHNEQHRFLSLLGQLPARLTAEQTGWVLNCQSHDLPALVAARLLKPLGNPAANSVKFFATSDVIELAKDRAWLVKITTTINQHWHKQNAKKKCVEPNRRVNGHASVLALPPVVDTNHATENCGSAAD